MALGEYGVKEGEHLRVRLGVENLGEVSEFKYLGSFVSPHRSMEAKLKYRRG